MKRTKEPKGKRKPPTKGSFLMVNKRTVAREGPLFAIWMANLIDKHDYWKKRNMLDEDGMFYLTQKEQCIQTSLSPHQQRACKNRAVFLEIIDVRRKGDDYKDYFFIHWEVLKGFGWLNNSTTGGKKIKPPVVKKFNLKETVSKETEINTNTVDFGSGDKNLNSTMFDMFWELYPNKANKATARMEWNTAMSKPDTPSPQQICDALRAQCESDLWTKQTRFIPYAGRWIREGRWIEDASTMIYKPPPVNRPSPGYKTIGGHGEALRRKTI